MHPSNIFLPNNSYIGILVSIPSHTSWYTFCPFQIKLDNKTHHLLFCISGKSINLGNSHIKGLSMKSNLYYSVIDCIAARHWSCHTFPNDKGTVVLSLFLMSWIANSDLLIENVQFQPISIQWCIRCQCFVNSFFTVLSFPTFKLIMFHAPTVILSLQPQLFIFLHGNINS